mmetsp:Transcript_128766/g.227891  ORF Transcript_128766/g.227891 Transcript_128766/m.227891 type:complete len:98 (-) Transcript_128766:219-512(-)
MSVGLFPETFNPKDLSLSFNTIIVSELRSCSGFVKDDVGIIAGALRLICETAGPELANLGCLRRKRDLSQNELNTNAAAWSNDSRSPAKLRNGFPAI